MNLFPRYQAGLIFNAATICVLMVGSAFAATFTDATGDGTFITTWPHLDISSVDVTNNATDISFTINLVGDPIVTNWGEYQVSIDSIAGGATSGTLPPNRPYSMSSGMDYYIRSWNTGAETYHWDAGGPYWALGNATYNPPSDIQVPSKTASTVTLTTTLASIGLSLGDSFDFDVWSAGGTGSDGPFDALANSNPTAFGEDFQTPYEAGSNVYTYTVVPEPSTIILGIFSAAALMMRRKGND